MTCNLKAVSRVARVALAAILIGLIAACASHVKPAHADTRQLGVNIAAPDFVNVMKTARFITADNAPQPAFDAAGWPLHDCTIVVLDKRVNMRWNGPDPLAVPEDVHGTYSFSCVGKVDITPGTEDPAAVTVENLAYNAATNVTTANLVLAPGHNLFVIGLANTNGGVKNIRIIRPGYPANTRQIFTAQYMKALKPFALIRCMDLLSTNGYPIFEGTKTVDYDWSMRRLPTDAIQTDAGNKFGVALEYAIEIANENDQDLWVNVPVSATDDYVKQMAALVHKALKPSLRVYVEYSNEVWNWGFHQSIWVMARAKNEVAGGSSNLNSDGEKTDWKWQSRLYTRRVIEISKIYQAEFGPGSLDSRVRPVLVWQTGSQDNVRGMLTWAKSNFGDPKQYIWGVGDGMYYTPTDFSSVDAIMRTQEVASDNLKADTIAFATLAHDFGMHRVVYEGGSDMNGASDLANKLAASRDPRMTESTRHFLIDNYFNAGGEILCYYAFNNGYGPYGNYGLIDRDVTKLDSPKYKGAIEALAELHKATN